MCYGCRNLVKYRFDHQMHVVIVNLRVGRSDVVSFGIDVRFHDWNTSLFFGCEFCASVCLRLQSTTEIALYCLFDCLFVYFCECCVECHY